jgi:uncharacterized SAM-dependent methyltransferase
MLTPSLPLRHVSEFASDVRDSLTKPGQRELPSKYLYDEVGSALFETICVLPEYGLTRADARLLERYAGEIVGRLPSPIRVAELGSGCAGSIGTPSKPVMLLSSALGSVRARRLPISKAPAGSR